MTDLSWTRPLLAELVGYTTHPNAPGAYFFPPRNADEVYGGAIDFQNWRPDEDVAQAIRCLEAAHKQGMGYCIEQAPDAENATVHVIPKFPEQDCFFIHFVEDMERISEQAGNLPRAIVLAIVAAKGWKQT